MKLTHSSGCQKLTNVDVKTNAKRWLFIAFTIRENKIRVISARDMSQKEGKSMLKPIPEFENDDEEREF
ncbi:MAG: BrnT family toxin [Chloroflexota bacterium]|nr:BrnT family toxin [Chloroflexota bacterium]